MSEMDWETSGQPFPTHPNIQRERCPYRPPTDAAGNFQFPGLLPQQANPNMPFHPTHAPPQTFWDNISHQNMPSHEGMNNRFVQMSNPHPPGRAPEIANFDYQIGLDGHSPPSGPTRHSRFDGSRPLPQRTRSYHNGMQSAAEAQAALALGASQSHSSGAVELGSSYNGGMARRNGSAPSMPQANGSSNLQASPSRHLPPPNSAYHGLFLGQNNAYPQPRFSPDGTARNGVQGSTSTIPPHPPTLPRETSWARAESGSRNSAHRNWFHEAFYSAQNADMDSDEEPTEPQEESLRRQARLDPHATLQLLHEQMRLAGGPRRVNPFDAEGPETSLERARAARRAAAAAVKFVASPAALASLEPVDLNTLTGDEKSCIICYNEFGLKNPDGFIECPVRLPKCKHTFGDRCLKQWLQDSDSCPYCRDKLPSEPKRTPREDDVRRIIAQTRTYAMDPWYAAEMSRLQSDPASHVVASEREQHYRQLVQQRLDRNEDSSDDILARMRRREDYDWSTSFNQSSIGVPSRSMPDYDGRRRYRGRHSVSRTATQAAGRTNGPNANRLSRNVSLQAGPMRAPVHSSTSSFDENPASQRRSVTPHPTITGIPTWSSPPLLQNTTSGRPSSLPTERSPLGEATEVRPNALGSRTPSGSSTLSTPLIDTPWLESHHAANNPLIGWRMPITSNGRPASASFINDMPQSRLQQLHEDLDSLGVHIQNHRLPPYMTASNDADPDTHMGNANRR